jgi:hypothetical protein
MLLTAKSFHLDDESDTSLQTVGGVTSQKTAFFIVTVVETSNLT